MSRYPPQDQRFPPRDRSPARFQERRPSAAFNNYQGPGPGNRPLDDNAAPSATRDPPREPPRGPKALENTPRGSSFAPSGPRGRGFGGRLDFHDREYYNSRDAPSFRRDGDNRDWTRRERDFDSRDSRPMYGRGKSRSPLRDFRDTREGDIGRIRRDSVASLPQNTEPSISHGSHLRGLSSRGRGRGEWDRGRGRGTTFIDDRANDFHPRSRSRERLWDRRDDRDWGDRENGRDRTDRRDDDRRPEYNERQRPGDRWKENRPPSRTGSLTNPSTPHPPSVASSLPASADKAGTKDGYDPSRRISSTPYLGNREGRTEEKLDYFSTRHEPSKERYTPRVASPPPAPQVPAFGSVNPKTSIGVTPASGPKTPGEKPHHQPPAAQAPSTAPATTAPSNSSAIQSRPEVKPAASQSVVQAPTGPRAERSEKQADALSRDTSKAIDTWNRHDVPFRGNLSLSTPVGGRLAASNVTAGSHSNSDLQGATSQTDHMQSKSPVLQSTQGRPGSSSSQTFGRNVPGLATSPGLPSSAPTRPLASITSPRAPIANIPTGPRAQRELMPTSQRPAARGSMQWISPKAPQYPPRGPSIMNTVPVRPGYRPEDKDRPLSSGKGAAKSPVSEHSPSLERRMMLSPRQATRVQPAHASEAPRRDEADETLIHGHKTQLEERRDANLPASLGQSSDEVGEDEDMDLDEEDFEEAEKKFELDMEALKLRKPPPTLKDPIIIDLLFQLQALEIIANESAHHTIDEAMEIDKEVPEQQPPPGLPSPILQEGEQPTPEERPPPLKELPFNRPPTPKIEDLPFLNAEPLTPFSDIDEIQETLAAYERNKETLREQLLDQMEAASHKNEELRRQYSALYRPWRLEVREMDQVKRKAKKEITPLPASPPPSVTPAVTPAPPEGRRALKFGSEFDLERVMQESVQTHREEQEKRESEAKARADPRREAIIPDMREDYEADSLQFIDGNGLVQSVDALHVFRYVPPMDDFTPEEHEVFLKAYVMYPKKFGKIAEALPENRDFKQCIQHYYLTKQEANYKAECNKGMRRKGRKRGKVSRANALMSDLNPGGRYDDGEFDNPPAPVTDTGRPRRAAAPTFGDTPVDTDGSGTNGASSMRRGAMRDSGDQPAEKPARRARGGGAPRGSRKSRMHQPVAVVPGPSPQRLPALQLSPQKDEQRQDLEGANMLASLHNPRAEDRPLMPNRDAHMSGPALADSGPVRPPKQKAWTGGQTPTSYWSVPEQNDFPKYVAHFGKDYVAIATYMQTKTPIMVKNYFLRSVEQGKWELEEMAQQVEEKRQRGEPMGPPPARTMVAKRRYDATPSSATQRPLAPSTDGMDIDSGSPPTLRPTQPQHSPPSLPTTQPKLHPLVLAQQAQASTPLPLTAPPGEIRPKMHRPPQGPRVGYFTEERKDTPAVPHMGSTHQQPQHPIPPPVEPTQQMLRTEPVHTSTRRQMPEQGPPKNSQMQQSAQQQAPTLHQASAPTLWDHLITHGGNLTVDIVNGQPQTVFKREDDNPSLRRIEQYSIHAKDRAAMQDKVLSPTENPYSSQAKEVPRPSSTPAQIPEAPRPAPAPTKRINIMSMLNDEVETQPPKRLKEVHDETPKTQSPASTYQSQSLPLSRVDSQSHTATPVQAHSQPYTSSMQYALQHQSQAQQAQQPRSAGPYQEVPRWPSQKQSEWINQFDPRPSRGSTAYSPRLTTTNSPPVHAAFAPPPATILRHSNQQAVNYNQHAPSPPPQPTHQSHYRSSSQQQQQHARMPSYGHQPSPTVGPQHPAHTGPPPIPAIHRHPYAAPSPPPATQAQAPPPPQQPRPGGSRDYFPQQHIYHPPGRPAPAQPLPREMELRREEDPRLQIHERLRQQQADVERRQPGRTFTPPNPRAWLPYLANQGGGGGAGGANGGSGEKREIY
jgi:hypothetical protein